MRLGRGEAASLQDGWQGLCTLYVWKGLVLSVGGGVTQGDMASWGEPALTQGLGAFGQGPCFLLLKMKSEGTFWIVSGASSSLL